MLTGLLAACGGADTPSGAPPASVPDGGAAGGGAAVGEGQVYFQNFKPEQDEAYQAIAAEYTALTGVPVKVVTAASGTYEQTLRSELAKNDAPTIFQVNGPVGYAAWKAYCDDLSGTEIYGHLSDKSLAITDGGVYGIPFAIEGYGIIVNNRIMQRYFESDGAKAASLEEINTFAKLKEVVEDMTAQKDALGIEGVFASTSLKPGEDWRWQTHLMNVPMYCEWHNNNVDLSVEANTVEITFEYGDNFKNIFDLYLNNSTVAPTMTGSKTVDDSMAEFALGQAAMVQNGNWAYGQISNVEGNTVQPEDVSFLPIYIGVAGEESQGLCIGTENFFCINKNASDADRQASLDFLTWLYTSDVGKAHVTNDLGFIAPFDSFTDTDKPADPLGQQVMEWNAKAGITNVPWNFTVFPSQQFKDNFGGNLLLYAQGQLDWAAVRDAVISDWSTEKAAAA
jgi:raffinose/stachyose/melibiose transport system substrate-binding protein